MTPLQQADAFEKELWFLVDRYNSEFDISLETLVCKLAITIAALTSDEDDEN